MVKPSIAQVKAIVSFMEKNPELANRKQRDMSHEKYMSLWEEVSSTVNGLEGSHRPIRGWIKFWGHKKRFLLLKRKHINDGTISDVLTSLELRILDVCSKDRNVKKKRKITIKKESCNGEDNESRKNIYTKDNFNFECPISEDHLMSTDTDKRHIVMMEKLVEVMDRQAASMSQMAEATHTNSKALERIAEASFQQAMAVDKAASTFEGINTSVFDLRNAILNIGYNIKTTYTTSAQHRQNSHILT